MFIRKQYLDRILEFVDKPFVKVISGLRRSGKSTLLLMIKEELKNRGVISKNIVYINLESFNYSHISNAKKLYNHILDSIEKDSKSYVLIDEIQEVEEWEKFSMIKRISIIIIMATKMILFVSRVQKN